MNPWPFVIASYALTLCGTGAIAAWAYAAMVRAERAVDDLRKP